MATMISEVYDALKDAGASEDKARKAAEAIAAYEGRFAKTESDLKLLQWMVGFNIAMTTAVLWKVFSISRLVAMFRISNLDRNSRVRHRPPKRHRITQSYACVDDLLKSDSASSPHAHAPRRCADWRGICSPLFARA